MHYADLRRLTVKGITSPDYVPVELRDVWSMVELLPSLESIGWKETNAEGFGLLSGRRAYVQTNLIGQLEAHWISVGGSARLSVWKLPKPDARWRRKS